MNEYKDYSIEDLEKLKDDLMSQRCNLDNTIDNIVSALKYKRCNVEDSVIRNNPYYKDKSVVLKVTITNSNAYLITRIKPQGTCISIDQIIQPDTKFLKYYKMCSKGDWDNALDRLNIWFKDSNIKVSNED